jgi:hypothetical protein
MARDKVMLSTQELTFPVWTSIVQIQIKEHLLWKASLILLPIEFTKQNSITTFCIDTS